MTRRLVFILGVVFAARYGRAQSVAERPATPRARVYGIVTDSLAGARLVAAVVQIVGVEDAQHFGASTETDSLGHFRFVAVPAGRYTLGFFHPILDSLGLSAPLKQVSVANDDSVRADLALPSPGRMKSAVCGKGTREDSGAVLVGFVRDARRREPAESATVKAEWLEITIGERQFARRVAERVVTTSAQGWFALCDVPRGGALLLRATRNADSTDQLELRIPTSGFAHRELYVGTAKGRIRGTVVRTSGEPIGGAQISVPAGPETRSTATGEFELNNVSTGTRMLDIRAVGLYPERRIVDVLADSPTIQITMSTLLAVLDTVRISATRRADPRQTGFMERQRTGMGRMLTAVDIAKRQPRSVSDLLKSVMGIHLERFSTYVDTSVVDTTGTGTNPIGSTSDTRVLMRASVKDWCFPTFFIDGHQVNTLTAEEIDSWLRPEELTAVEVYNEFQVPPQFRVAMSGCGTILIWRK